ncbi:imelysin family protein [Pleionea sediminis]|uniref:imelysin family protein n=1 Tax=Pleionea sediminis TaxID=2569479 RepID=UPI0013DE6943|nr:imelysin family protein [Pleionea sediminis]
MKIRKLIQSIAIALSTSLLITACSDNISSTQGDDFNSGNDNDGGPSSFNESALLSHLTNNIITPTFLDFEVTANQLNESVNQYCTIEKQFNAGNATQQERDNQLLETRDIWRQSMVKWQRIEVMQLGPLVENQNLLRNKIYSWPVTSTCAVDQDIVFFNQGNINGEDYNIANRVATRRGLDALEYLLFNTNLNHSCSETTAPQGWEGLSDNTKREQRCEFATEVANDIANNTQILLDAWSGENGYANSLLNAADQPGSDFNNVHEAVNRVSDAMFYIDSFTKDAKLAKPLGVFENSCQQNICPENLESQHAQHSLENIHSNLLALKALFTGEVTTHETTTGFDDYLIEEGASLTANNLRTAIDAAIADVEAYQATLKESLENNDVQVRDTHQKVKTITDQLKTDFINQLALELPATSAGDND